MTTNSVMETQDLRLLGAGSREFLNALKEHVRMQRPQIVVLLETHISEVRAEDVCRRIGFGGQYRFNNWIENNALLDIGFTGPTFTWVRGRTPSTRKSARLDRALCNMAWRRRRRETLSSALIRPCTPSHIYTGLHAERDRLEAVRILGGLDVAFGV
ncbi:hypothetical protein Cgig2_026784 [Carnegiea gigantea]|uniref:Uncharacterized protein n=1 Tax=Carnegiea gigantea TaxID=171969 RepID=A0A9Q1JKB2_9CARY|nr:hypothetical protein Cgig2_026784 [Carnegiea gigantea]